MPLFYFNIRNDHVTQDDEGLEFADAGAAHAYAITAARSLAAESVGAGRLVLSHYIEVEDAAHESVARVTFADAIDVRP